MRTIRFTFQSKMPSLDTTNSFASLLGIPSSDNMIEVSTEVIVGDDDDIEAEGVKVGEVVGNFLSGVSEGMHQG